MQQQQQINPHQQTANNNDEGINTIVEEKIIKSNGDTLIKRYLKGKFLGKGGFAKCYDFTSLDTKKLLAAKIVPKASLSKSRAKSKLMSEIRIHRSLHHQNVVGFEHFFEDAENVYILLELCQNQTLNEMVKRRKRLTELEAQCYALQIISALKYLHAHRVIHRDLKLGNLFLTDKMQIKIGDFGLASKLDFEGEKKRTVCGTPNYIAPEILEGKNGHSYEVDIWSFGVILYTLIIGKPPFETQDVKTTYRRIKMNAYSFPESVTISDEAKSLITLILNLEPTKRPSLDEILDHNFFHNGNTIPKLLPASTLACPPSQQFIKQFMGSAISHQDMSKPQGRFESTAPVQPHSALREGQNNFNATDRFKQSDKPQTSQGQRNQIKANQSNGPDVWVKKWVDYSSKYGLGYLLSNDANGVFFNDNTKLILDPKGFYFDYMERRGAEKQDFMSSHTLTEYPKEIQKKVTLLLHFKSYLESDQKPGELVKIQKDQEHFKDHSNTVKTQGAPIYVKKWMRTRHAIMFRLSNKIVQVNFQDHTEIILCSESRLVTYVNKKGERQTFSLQIALESTNQEMSKRLKYTKDILSHMISLNTGGNVKQPNGNI
eukprot:403352526